MDTKDFGLCKGVQDREPLGIVRVFFLTPFLTLKLNSLKKDRPLPRPHTRPRVLLTPLPGRTSENLTEKANDLSKILCNIQYTLQSRKLKA